MEVRRSEVWLNPEFDCCRKYKFTLPPHVKIMGESEINIQSSLESSKQTISKQAVVPRSLSLLSGRYQCWQPIYEEVSYTVSYDSKDEPSSEEHLFLPDFTGEGLDESAFGKKLITEESISDLAEPISHRGKRLLKRPPSPDGEVFNKKKPKKMVLYNSIKYKGVHESWPEPPSLEERLLRRRWAPSPNISLPGSRTKLIEVAEEGNTWIEGHFTEEYINEFVAEGENGGYYRIHKKWLEGYWKPAEWLVELQRRENSVLAKEARRILEEQEKYEEILKRADSPGMNIIDWGDGPVEMIKWKKDLLPVDDRSELFLLPTSKSHNNLSSDSQSEIYAKLSEALLKKAENKVVRLLESHLSKNLNRHSVDNIHLEPSTTGSVQFKTLLGRTSEDKLWLDVSAELGDSSNPSYSTEKKAVEVPYYYQVVPNEFRKLLYEFLRQFVKDAPDDALNYAINYFQNLMPKQSVDKPNVSRNDSVEYFTRRLHLRRNAVCLASIQPEVPPSDFVNNDFQKTENEIDSISATLNDCFLFENIPLVTYTEIIRNMRKREVSTGEVIMLNDNSRCMYVIQKGSFEVTKLIHEEDEPRTIVIRDSGYFNENCLVEDAVHHNYAVATECGTLWCIQEDVYRFLSVLGHFERRINVARLMNGSNLFDKLDDEEKDKLIDCLTVRHFGKGEVVFCQDTTPDGIYFVLSGAIKLVSIVPMKRGFKKHRSSVIWNPAVLGESNFINEEHWEASCVAGTRVVEVAILTPQVFVALVGEIKDVLNRPTIAWSVHSDEQPGEIVSHFVPELTVEWDGEQDMEHKEETEENRIPKMLPLLKFKVTEDEKKIESDSDDDTRMIKSIMGDVEYRVAVDSGFSMTGVGPLKTCDFSKFCQCSTHLHGMRMDAVTANPANKAPEVKKDDEPTRGK